ncbi:MAG TPA: hypothetical protein VH436_34835 [Vicinamibacterales bacterium]
MYLAVQGATVAYFVREQETLISNASTVPREALSAGGNRWTSLNDVRNIGGVLAFVFLMMAAFAPSVP